MTRFHTRKLTQTKVATISHERDGDAQTLERSTRYGWLVLSNTPGSKLKTRFSQNSNRPKDLRFFMKETRMSIPYKGVLGTVGRRWAGRPESRC
jgi:hypothetical protein